MVLLCQSERLFCGVLSTLEDGVLKVGTPVQTPPAKPNQTWGREGLRQMVLL